MGSAIYDDHMPLLEAGIPVVDIIDMEYPDAETNYWHTLADTPDKCSAESLEAVGTVLATLIYTEVP
jgi:Zn-dependent M28 family amino/carboxypeptidase